MAEQKANAYKATRPSKEQLELMDRFTVETGWSFIGEEDVSANDRVSFIEKWDENIKWLHDKADEVGGMITAYRNETLDKLETEGK